VKGGMHVPNRIPMPPEYDDLHRRLAGIIEPAILQQEKFKNLIAGFQILRVTHAEYRQAKQDMKDIQMAKYNVDLFLKFEEQKELAEKQKTTEQTQ
jgi:hypothetical protein